MIYKIFHNSQETLSKNFIQIFKSYNFKASKFSSLKIPGKMNDNAQKTKKKLTSTVFREIFVISFYYYSENTLAIFHFF